jgi:hypothetical protein
MAGKKVVAGPTVKKDLRLYFILFFCPPDYGRHIDPERQQRMQKTHFHFLCN